MAFGGWLRIQIISRISRFPTKEPVDMSDPLDAPTDPVLPPQDPVTTPGTPLVFDPTVSSVQTPADVSEESLHGSEVETKPGCGGAAELQDSADRAMEEGVALEQTSVEESALIKDSTVGDTGSIQLSADADTVRQDEEHKGRFTFSPQWVSPEPYIVTTLTKGAFAGFDAIGEAGSLPRTRPFPADQFEPVHRPDFVADMVNFNGLNAAAASLRGFSHFSTRTVRQDSYALHADEETGFLIGVIADGVSQGKYSQRLADHVCGVGIIAVQNAMRSADPSDRLGSADWTELVEEIVNLSRKFVRSQPDLHPRDKRRGDLMDPHLVPDKTWATQMATTFDILLVHAIPDASGNRPFAHICAAGDSSAYVLDPERGWAPMSIGKDQSNDLASNEVIALPLNPGVPSVQIGLLEPGQALVTMTDGIGDHMALGRSPLAGYLHKRWQKTVNALAFAESVGFVSFQADDDRTALIMWG